MVNSMTPRRIGSNGNGIGLFRTRVRSCTRERSSASFSPGRRPIEDFRVMTQFPQKIDLGAKASSLSFVDGDQEKTRSFHIALDSGLFHITEQRRVVLVSKAFDRGHLPRRAYDLVLGRVGR